MFRGEYASRRSTVHRAIRRLTTLLARRRVGAPLEAPRLLFLCGANKSDGALSARRQAILALTQRHLPNVSTIIAEHFFERYYTHGGKRNLYDLEKELSNIADHVVIILEGHSSFCELGAFAHETLRSKLLVINDAQFRASKSFINLGPIEALNQPGTRGDVLWYPMSSTGVEYLDSIGRIFPDLLDRLRVSSPRRRRLLEQKALEPTGSLTKDRLLFLHDLIFFSGPLSYRSLIDLLKLIFGDKSYNLSRTCISLLISLDFISYPETSRLLESRLRAPFFQYDGYETFLKTSFALSNLRRQVRAYTS